MERGTGPSRTLFVSLVLATGLTLPPMSAASAKDLPAIKASDGNTVPACVTPGRLTSFLKTRNPKLDSRYETVAQEYKRHGEALGIRWDYAFFQMLLETGNLKYTGDVKPEQNNFAGLGATGGGVRGESFPDISTGVRAHLEHLLLYSGTRVDRPVAERTRNIQEWGVLSAWQKTITGPVTFTHMGRKWAPTDRNYARDIDGISEKFADGPCRDADPGEQVAAKPDTKPTAPAAKPAPKETAATTPAATQAPPNGKPQSAGLSIAAAASATTTDATAPAGAASIAKSAEGAKGSTVPGAAPQVNIINAPKDPPADAAAAAPAKGDKPITVAGAATAPSSSAPLAKPDAGKTTADAMRCRVFTASYGGQKSIIIKAVLDNVTNYTVLDVNDGAEKREAEAYISAYAKGGETVGEFANQNAALDKAFELCPER